MAGFKVTFVALFVASVISAQPTPSQLGEFHLTADKCRQIYLNSVFAHGHRHGYEEGFHDAEVDYQMGRGFRQFESPNKVPKTVGYYAEFGSKKLFRKGYEYGYIAGYTDSAAGRSFRMTKEVEMAKRDPANQRKAYSFEDGVIEGYRSGRSGAPATALSASSPPAIDCADGKAGEVDYCQGFKFGVSLGEADRRPDDAVRYARGLAQLRAGMH